MFVMSLSRMSPTVSMYNLQLRCRSSSELRNDAWARIWAPGRNKRCGAHARRAEGMCLEEGTTVYDECERPRLRGVELPRGRLNNLDQHVGQDDGVLCLVMELPAVRGQGGKGTGACSAQQLRQTTEAEREVEHT